MLLIGSTSAQEPLAEIIFGPRDGDNAGVLYAYENSFIEVDVWMRTAPGISIQGMHLPLSSNDNYIASRDDGVFFAPVVNWPTREFLAPNEDPDHSGYTNQGILGVCTWGEPNYGWGIHTEGNWLKVASYLMISVSDAELNTLFCNAFIEGSHPINGGIILSEYSQPGESMDPSTYEVRYACLEFRQNECGLYIVGDFNGSGEFNVADIISSFSKLSTGSPEPGMTCECPSGSGNVWGVAMDVNNSCAFNVADIVIAYQKLALGHPELIPCAQCPPSGP